MKDIINTVTAQGGVTLSKDLTPYNGKGYAVALKKDAEIVVSDADFSSVADTIISGLQHSIKDNNVYIGIWKDADKVYIDLSEILDNKEQAITKGKERDQIAVFDFNTFESIYIK